MSGEAAMVTTCGHIHRIFPEKPGSQIWTIYSCHNQYEHMGYAVVKSTMKNKSQESRNRSRPGSWCDVGHSWHPHLGKRLLYRDVWRTPTNGQTKLNFNDDKLTRQDPSSPSGQAQARGRQQGPCSCTAGKPKWTRFLKKMTNYRVSLKKGNIAIFV